MFHFSIIHLFEGFLEFIPTALGGSETRRDCLVTAVATGRDGDRPELRGVSLRPG